MIKAQIIEKCVCVYIIKVQNKYEIFTNGKRRRRYETQMRGSIKKKQQ